MNAQKYRTVFISDVHLGTPECKADYLLDFLNTVEMETLYLVGDIVDIIAMKKKYFWPQRHQDVLHKIFELAQSGTKVIYIPGNHDHVMRLFAGQSLKKIEVRRNDLFETVDGRVFMVSHGDEFDGVVRCHPLLKFLGDQGNSLLMGINDKFNRLRKIVGLPYWSLAGRIKKNLKKAMVYVERFENAAVKACEKSGVDGYICGHIHYARLREEKGRIYCNDGDWVEHCTSLVEDFAGTLQIIHWTERREVLVKEERENQTEPVPEEIPAAAMASLKA